MVVCKVKVIEKKISNPNISDGSQFHQPPHEPSWYAHQLPSIKENEIEVAKIKAMFKSL